MLSRRVFLLSAFAVPGLSLLPGSAMSAYLASSKVLVLSDSNCADGENFTSALPATNIAADPGPVLLELDNSFKTGEYDFVFGLTRDSNFVLIEQYAQASSFQLSYSGLHSYNEKGLTHTLRGNVDTLSSLSGLLNKDQSLWSSAVAQVPLLSEYKADTQTETVLHTSHRSPQGSSGHLVSWLFKRSKT